MHKSSIGNVRLLIPLEQPFHFRIGIELDHGPQLGQTMMTFRIVRSSLMTPMAWIDLPRPAWKLSIEGTAEIIDALLWTAKRHLKKMNRNFRECGGQEVSGAVVLNVQDRVGIADEDDLGRLNEPDGIKECRCDAALIWLLRLERGENVIVNLRLDTDVETEFVSFDRPGWSACSNESPLTWITSAWCRMIRRPTKSQTKMILKHVTAVSWPSRHESRRSSVPESSGLRCERSWDYRQSKKIDCVFRKLNALPLFSVPLLPNPLS